MRYELVNGQPKWTFQFYGLGGQRMAQITCMTWPWPTNFACLPDAASVYFGGKLIAETDGSGHVLTPTDRLGTVRGVDTNGTWAEPTYFPYGEPRTAGGVDGKQQFATYVRDSTPSAQDYAGARYYSNVYGRFFSADPSGVAPTNPKVPGANVELADPGTWNQYAYVTDDPINSNDPSGLGFWSNVWNSIVSFFSSEGEYIAPGDPGAAGVTHEVSQRLPNCPPVPTLPGRNATDEILKNVADAKDFLSTAIEGDPDGALLALFGYLTGVFMPSGSEDYKSQYPAGSQNAQAAMVFGNFNYGAVLESLGFTLKFTQSVAGTAQIAICGLGGACGDGGFPFIQPPYGDQVVDQADIQKGFAYQRKVDMGCQ
jgi:RHS repeat-associated protein